MQSDSDAAGWEVISWQVVVLLDLETVLFAAAVVTTVLIGQRMRVARRGGKRLKAPAPVNDRVRTVFQNARLS